MSQYPHQTVVIHHPASTSGLAIAGLIFSILGWLTCGLLCIPGAFLCLLALFSRSKGTAIAGLIVGFPGTLFFVFVGLGMIMGILGLGAAATTAVRDADRAQSQSQVRTQTPAVPQSPQSPNTPPVSSRADTPPASELNSTTTTLPPPVALPQDIPSFVAQYVIRKHLDKPVSFTANDKPESVNTQKPWETWLVYGSFTADGMMSSYTCMFRMSEKHHVVIVFLNIDGIAVSLGERQEFTLNDKDLLQIGEPAEPPKPAHEFDSLHARRTWTSAAGAFSVEATFVSSSGDEVKLRKTDGKTITVDLSKLSDDDQMYVRESRR